MSNYLPFDGEERVAAIHDRLQGVSTVWDLLPPDGGFGARLIPVQPEGPSSETARPDRKLSSERERIDELLGSLAISPEMQPADT